MRFEEGAQKDATWAQRGHPVMKHFLRVLDNFTQLFGEKEIVVTSAIRPPREGSPSFHPVGQAFDLRTKDRDQRVLDLWILCVITFRSVYLNFPEFEGKIQYLLEDQGGENEHMHFQYKGNGVKPL
jgi:hypothetical protein